MNNCDLIKIIENDDYYPIRNGEIESLSESDQAMISIFLSTFNRDDRYDVHIDMANRQVEIYCYQLAKKFIWDDPSILDLDGIIAIIKKHTQTKFVKLKELLPDLSDEKIIDISERVTSIETFVAIYSLFGKHKDYLEKIVNYHDDYDISTYRMWAGKIEQLTQGDLTKLDHLIRVFFLFLSHDRVEQKENFVESIYFVIFEAGISHEQLNFHINTPYKYYNESAIYEKTIFRIKDKLYSFPDFLTAFKTQTCRPDWQSFVVRVGNWGQVYNNSNQLLFGTFMSIAVHQTASQLRQAAKVNFTKLLNHLSNARAAMGIYLNHFRFEAIGKPRAIAYNTPCNTGYVNLGRKLREMHGHLQSIGSSLLTKDGFCVSAAVMNESGEEEKLSLSKIVFYDEFQGVEHTDHNIIKKLLNFVEHHLFTQLLEETNPDMIIERSGEVFWWICQIKPWHLGDPSIAEMLVKSVMLAKGVETISWKAEMIPWEEVMVDLDAQTFGKRFKDLLE